MSKSITEERALTIARSHACPHCLEYSFKRITIDPAPASHAEELRTAWVIRRVCGICGLEQEIGLDARGDVVYGG